MTQTQTPLIELRENAPPREYELDDAVGRALAESRIVRAARDVHVPGVWRLSADRFVGAAVVTVPGARPGVVPQSVVIRIAPKVHVGRLFFLLGYALNPKGWREDQIDVAEHAELLPALAHAFERQCERALRQGLLQGYRRTQDSAMVVRGRIREGEQLRRRFGAALPVEIEYDEYTTDIAENQILRAAVERLLRLAAVTGDVRRRLLHQRFRLADVTPPTRGHRAPLWTTNRLNVRYVPALRLAEIVLRGGSVEHELGPVRVDGFLFDMSKIFEDFVAVALRERLSTSRLLDSIGAPSPPRGGYADVPSAGTVKLQAHHHLDEAKSVLLRPDLVWYDVGGRPLAVVDAKYKAEKPEGFPGADLYQLLAYCTVLGLPEGHLIYAKGNAAHADHIVQRVGIRIHQHALDLEQSPDAILIPLDRIADQCVRSEHHRPQSVG